MKTVRFYFDFLSPFSYLAWQWVKTHYSRDGFKLEVLPVSMIPIIKSHETKGPAEIRSKREYLYRFCSRYAEKNGIPFSSPLELPFNSQFCLRLAIAARMNGCAQEVIDEIFHWAWALGGDPGDPEAVLAMLAERGFDASTLEELADGREARKSLKRNNAEALESGLFGVPSFVVDGQLFWGLESIADLEDYLAGKDQLNEKSWRTFLEKTSSLE